MFQFEPHVPYYYQIQRDLVRRIERGEFKVGDQLPPETALAETYGVSRPTVRQALAALVQDGLVERGQGRGTFVAQPLIIDNAQIFTTFDPAGSPAGSDRVRLIRALKGKATAAEGRELGIAEDDAVSRVIVVRENRGESVAYRESVVPAILAPDLLTRHPEPLGLYQILQEDYGLTAAGAVQSFKAVPATRADTVHLRIRGGDPVMLWQGVIYSTQKLPMAFVRTVFRGDRFRFVITQGKDTPQDAARDAVGVGILDTIEGHIW